ncbi:radical SAM protein [Candidatus Bathyarchaeota archaeon]|nr:radical SAM protein [Candidatus Bathyarchaeota archaeon]
MPLISRFDPWRSGLCTCPSKLSFNPYTGCDHQCLYCYATSYIPNHRTLRTKESLLCTLRREVMRLNGEILAMSSSSDPYPTVESELGLTRQCLKIIKESSCRLQVFTKSDIVARDADLLEEIPCTVALTITTDNDQLSAIIEPKAPPPSKRLKAIETLISHDVPVIVRVDPIIPTVNDNPAKLICTLAALGVKHITSSTYKVKADNWMRLTQTLPETAEKLRPLYFEQGEISAGSRLLPRELRLKLLKNMRYLTEANCMRFGVCREGFSELNSAQCDGSWLMPKAKEASQCRLA